MSVLRKVLVTVSAVKTGEEYRLAKSYPDNDLNDDLRMEVYTTPVYKIFLDGTDEGGNALRKEWAALRFMPYWNDPRRPNPHYATKGWVNSGLHYLKMQPAPGYLPDYMVLNSVSSFGGAIQLKGNFLIHAGPDVLTTGYWGSAGCVEVIGNFDEFRTQILTLAGSEERDIPKGMTALVKARKLLVQVDLATPPDFRANLVGERPYPQQARGL